MDLFVFDDDYLRRLKEGDGATVGHFVRYFTLHFTLKLRPRAPGEIDDIIQEVFFRVFNGLRKGNTVRDARAFGAYVSSIGKHVVQEGFQPRRQGESLDFDIPSSEDVFRNLVTSETKRRVHRYMERLEREDRRSAGILRDVFLDELEKDEICRKHGVERSYLRVLIFRALKKFRDMLDENETKSPPAALCL